MVWRHVAAGAVGLVVGVLLQRTIAVDPDPYVVRPLPEAARHAVHTMMRAHGGAMNRLLSSVFASDFEAVKAHATEIAERETLRPPKAGEEGTVNADIPPEFYAFQTALSHEAQTLSQAAGAHNPIQVAQAFERVLKTCMQCHAAYMKPAEPAP